MFIFAKALYFVDCKFEYLKSLLFVILSISLFKDKFYTSFTS